MTSYECATANEDECSPLTTLEDVLTWKPKKVKFCTESLLERVHIKDIPKTLVCHDMKGGYLEDRFVHGVKKGDCYNFIHWSVVDIFVYFSHHLVTIPPCGWITAAHRNGTLVLGTFITEWDQGVAICDKILIDKDSINELCNQLVCIALFYGFDGWLINIENKIKPHQVKLLEDFVSMLTNYMHKAKSGSLIIWYDSIIESGELKWQNALNDQNRNFFHGCDGIFLNYNWTDELLKKSVVEAGPRLKDVYVGVDIFGRGCPGGGGFCSNVAVKSARDNGLSIAIFAPGWVYEHLGKENFLENQYKFWDLLNEFCPTHRMKSLPFSTSFCPGFGKKMYREGTVIDREPWYNLSLQQPQSTFHYLHGAPLGGSTTICLDDAYIGGGCLKINAPQTDDGKPHTFGILSTSFLLEQTCLISYTFKPISSSVDMILALDMSTFDKSYCLLLIGKNFNEHRIKMLNHMSPTSHSSGLLERVKFPATEDDLKTISFENIYQEMFKIDQSWITRTYIFEASEFKSHVINSVDAKILYTFTDENTSISVLFGQIKILPVEESVCFTYRDLMKSTEGNLIQIKCVLEWNSNPSIYCWDLCYKFNDNKKYICTTSQSFFHIDLKLELQSEVSILSIEFILRPQSVCGKFLDAQSLIVHI